MKKILLFLSFLCVGQASGAVIAVTVDSTNNVLNYPSAANFASANGIVLSSSFGTGVATALGTNVGTAGAFVVQNGALGTPSSGTLSSATGLPISTGVTGLGTGIATALAVNAGSAGAPVLFNGALGTPSSGTLTSATGLPISTGVSGLGTGIATALAVNTGSAGAPVLYNGAGGTPSALTLTNATGLPPAGVTGTAAILGANTFTGAQTNSTAGAASAPAVVVSGAPYAAGSATTNFPLFYINEAAATASTTLSTSGTSFGINKDSTSGNLMDLMVDGTSKFKVLATSGALTISGGGLDVTANSGGLVMRGTTPKITYNNYFSMQATAAGVATFSHDTTTSAMKIQIVPDQATVPAATITGGNSRSGTDSNTVGGALNIISGLGTGNAATTATVVNIQTPTAVASGTGAQTATTRLAVNSVAVAASVPVRLPVYTVSTLPTGTQGDTAVVTDATAPTYLGALTGGGSVVCPVIHNGTIWISH